MKSPSNANEMISKFIDFTEFNNKSEIRKILSKNSWNLDVALNEFLNNPTKYGGVVKSKKASTALSILFDKYKDEKEDAILVEGMELYCQDLEVDPSNVVMLIMAYKMNALKMCEFKRANFENYWNSVGIDSIQGMKDHLPRLLKCLDKPEEFDLIYLFTFDFGKEETQKSLILEIAIPLWQLLLTDKFKHLNHWITFLTEHYKKSISRDTWTLLLEFVKTVRPDLSNFDPMGAWPSVIDEFCEYLQSNNFNH